jgi:uncharacterized protein (DUF2235 family)
MAKNIVLFIDGTWNKPAKTDEENTNVLKLWKMTIRDKSQMKKYMKGIGTEKCFANIPMPIHNLSGGIFGRGSAKRIKRAYHFLSRHYVAGDNIYLFGFSRGAFAVRSLAGFIESVGLLLKKHSSDDVEKAFRIYKRGPQELGLFLRKIAGSEKPNGETVLPIYFIGVWDTVAALGLPGRLHKFSACFTKYHETGLPSNVHHFRHALSLHELRRQFEPLLWTPASPLPQGKTLVQCWFPGAHADIGGGYAESAWSDVALDWMIKEAISVVNGLKLDHGLKLDQQLVRDRLYANSSSPSIRALSGPAPIQHEIRQWFIAATPTVRKDLRATQSLHDATTDTFRMHPIVYLRLLKNVSTSYKFFRKDVNQRLREIDEISLNLNFEISLGPSEPGASAPIPEPTVEWWTTPEGTAIARTHHQGVEQFLASHAPIFPNDLECLARTMPTSLFFRMLCECENPLASFLAFFKEIRSTKRKLLKHEDPDFSLDGFQRWLTRLSIVIAMMETCESLFPERKDKLVAAIRELNEDRMELVNNFDNVDSVTLQKDLGIKPPVHPKRSELK